MTSDLARLRALNLMHVANIINLPMWRSEAKQAMDEYFDHLELCTQLAEQLGEVAESIERWLRAVEEVQRLRREGKE